MQLYGRGVRRRLAPMLGNDPRRLALAYSLLFTLPGTPVLRYGDEIGMGDDLALPERNAIRTPMQWSAESNAGFSDAPPARLERPVISGGEYGYERVNVEAQQREPTSLLSRVERMIRLRKEHPEFGTGAWGLIDTGDQAVLALRAAAAGSVTVAVHNVSDATRRIRLALPDDEASHLIDTLGGDRLAVAKDGACEIELEPFGFRWLRVAQGRAGGATRRG